MVRQEFIVKKSNSQRTTLFAAKKAPRALLPKKEHRIYTRDQCQFGPGDIQVEFSRHVVCLLGRNIVAWLLRIRQSPPVSCLHTFITDHKFLPLQLTSRIFLTSMLSQSKISSTTTRVTLVWFIVRPFSRSHNNGLVQSY